MRKDIRTIGEKLYREGFSAEDLQKLREHASRIRVGASLAVEAREKEHSIIYTSVGELYKKYPQKRTAYKACEEKTLRDMKLVMRYAVYSAALDDPAYGRDRMHYWFRTILNAYSFGKSFIEDAYRIAQKRASKTLGAKEAEALNAMIDDAIVVYNS